MVLAVLALLAALEYKVERDREARLSRERKARRLLLKDSQQIVAMPRMNHNEYHIFLSHVWGTGERQPHTATECTCLLASQMGHAHLLQVKIR